MELEAFSKSRATLEKQYENAVFPADSGLSEEELRKAIIDFKENNLDASRLEERTFLIDLIFRNAPIALEKDNPFPGKLQTFSIPREDVKHGYKVAERHIPGACFSKWDYELGISYQVDLSHIAPDWEAILKMGLPGLIERARKNNTPFHNSVVIVLEALAFYCRRIAKLNDNQIYNEIACHAPKTLHEAFALAYVFHDAIEYCNHEVRTMGHFDRLFIGFYRNDIREGRLTRESAKELIKYFWIAFYAKYQGRRFGKNFCFGPEINELSYLGMEAYYEMNIVDPKLSVLMRDDIPQDFLELYAKCIRDGRTGIVTLNYDIVVEGMVRHGRTREDAENFIPIGCYEPAVAGKEVSCSGGNYIILPQVLLKMLDKGLDYKTFDDLMLDLKQQFRQTIKVLQEKQSLCDLGWKYINPLPILSGTFESCMQNDRDISEAGAKYNTQGVVIAYLADLVDSLAAIKDLVYEKNFCTLQKIREVIAKDWDGEETLRLKIQRECPKWGNNNPIADEIAVEIATFVSDQLWTLPNGRGGTFYPSLFGQLVVEKGRYIGALPSGRKKGETLSKNADAAIGMDRNGVTAMMNSILKIDMRKFPNGTCTDIMLHPSSVNGQDGIKILTSIIRSFIKQGGTGIQFNIFDARILRDAQLHPEKYENLQVRVCGWNVRFIDLEPAAQETFIREAEAAAS